MPGAITDPPVSRPLRSPSGDNFSAALRLFFKILSAAIRRRYEAREAFHMGTVSDTVFGALLSGPSISELTNSAMALQELPNERTSITALFEEILYFNWTFRDVLEDPSEVPDQSTFFGESKGNVSAPGLIEGGLVIADSIQTLLEKLPKWIQKLLHVASEVVKLAHLRFDE